MALDLQIDDLRRMSGAARGLGNELKAERLKPQKHPRIEQWAGMNEQDPHGSRL